MRQKFIIFVSSSLSRTRHRRADVSLDQSRRYPTHLARCLVMRPSVSGVKDIVLSTGNQYDRLRVGLFVFVIVVPGALKGSSRALNAGQLLGRTFRHFALDPNRAIRTRDYRGLACYGWWRPRSTASTSSIIFCSLPSEHHMSTMQDIAPIYSIQHTCVPGRHSLVEEFRGISAKMTPG